MNYSTHFNWILVGVLLLTTYLAIREETFVQYDVSQNGYPPNGNWFPGDKKKFTGFIR